MKVIVVIASFLNFDGVILKTKWYRVQSTGCCHHRYCAWQQRSEEKGTLSWAPSWSSPLIPPRVLGR